VRQRLLAARVVAAGLAVLAIAAWGATATRAEGRFAVPALPRVEGPIGGPGAMYTDAYEAAQPESAASFGYVSEEYFVSGMAAGQPYEVRMLVTRPLDARRFSGQAVVEPKHPLGFQMVWNFTRLYLMPRGHAAVELSTFPQNIASLQGSNADRYSSLRATGEQTSDIFAQVGRLLKSPRSPLPGVRRLFMTGHSQSAGPTWPYMDAHHARFRLRRGRPIYDGFFPETTRTASRLGPFPDVDVPTILINSQLEVEQVFAEEGIDYRKPDSNRPGKQFRLYEVAGMPHHDSRVNPFFQSEPCDRPLNRFPYKPMVTMALDHLIRWVDKGVRPPRAKRISVTGGPGGEIELDPNGNAVGGVRSTYVDVPVATYSPLNTGPISFCEVLGSQRTFGAERLAALYGDHPRYVRRVNRRLDRLVQQGWYLRGLAPELSREAANFGGFEEPAGAPTRGR
jgi:Alpha/beta hydrolase domain